MTELPLKLHDTSIGKMQSVASFLQHILLHDMIIKYYGIKRVMWSIVMYEIDQFENVDLYRLLNCLVAVWNYLEQLTTYTFQCIFKFQNH